MLSIHSFPKAILHVDGDSFFASCEVAKDPSLRGKCVITGLERGIASSMSYEAKARGVTRAMSLSDIRKVCPEAIFLPSDYETYSLYSQRMYAIVRRYTEDIEEYSIDECFADLTGMRRPNKMSYEEMAINIKHDLDTELGMTFSVGLSVNKIMAKVGSKWKKPSGLTIIRGFEIEKYLKDLPVGKIWGIGPQTSAYLNKLGIITSLDFAKKSLEWIKEKCAKPYQEIHRELNGEFVYPLTLGTKHDYASISKTKTFTPPSKDRDFILSQLSKNIENACIKLRRHNLFTDKVAIFLKSQEFRYFGYEFTLSRSVCTPEEIMKIVHDNFDRVFMVNEIGDACSDILYRATGVTLMNLSHNDTPNLDLFGTHVEVAKMKVVHDAIDTVDLRYGKHTVYMGSSFVAMNKPAHRNYRATNSSRKDNILKGETNRKRIGLPMLGIVR